MWTEREIGRYLALYLFNMPILSRYPPLQLPEVDIFTFLFPDSGREYASSKGGFPSVPCTVDDVANGST